MINKNENVSKPKTLYSKWLNTNISEIGILILIVKCYHKIIDI